MAGRYFVIKYKWGFAEVMEKAGEYKIIQTDQRGCLTAAITRKFEEKPVEIREYTEYNEKEIVRLYTEVGWTAYTDNLSILHKGFENSLLVLGAYENNELAGIIRVVGDGFTIVFVQDILVFPDQQRKGVGRALLQEIFDRYKNVRQIELATDNTPKTIAFYKSMGFSEFSELGCCGFMKCG